MTRQILFAGPSLHGAEVSLAPDIVLCPPAAKGDVFAAAQSGATRIGIVDGTFDHGAAIWHKEILYVLDRGIEVMGAASMGALRAAECAAFGMIGIGRIYEDYAEGRRDADSDVALVHGPPELDFPPLTDALVDVEATLDRLRESALLTSAQHRDLATLARRQHFKERRWRELCISIGRTDLQDAFFSQKQTDAMALVEAMQGDAAPRRSSTIFNETMFFRDLAEDVTARRLSPATS